MAPVTLSGKEKVCMVACGSLCDPDNLGTSLGSFSAAFITLIHSESAHSSLGPLGKALTLAEPDPQMATQQL